MGVGAYALNNQVGSLAGQTIPAGIIVLGVFILLVSLLGIVAAWKEYRVLLAIYFVLLLLFTIILFAVGIAVYVEKDSAFKYISIVSGRAYLYHFLLILAFVLLNFFCYSTVCGLLLFIVFSFIFFFLINNFLVYHFVFVSYCFVNIVCFLICFWLL